MVELRNIQRQEGHQGKTIEEVGLRQQQRHLREIRYHIILDTSSGLKSSQLSSHQLQSATIVIIVINMK